MKRVLISLGALLVLAMAATDGTAQQRNGGVGQGRGRGVHLRVGNPGQFVQGQGGNRQQPVDSVAGNAVGEDLLRMWEEEKLAHDVYISLAKKSTLPIFRNISAAESRHMQAIERLIAANGGNANVLNDTQGVFVFPEYQRLFDTLVASGSRSPLDALMVGAKIEEMDIADLKRLLAANSDQQVEQVLQHLMHGSENHLRAFASQIALQGDAYQAEFLTQAEFDQIAESTVRGRAQQAGGRGAKQGGQRSQLRGNGGQSEPLGFGRKGPGGNGRGRQGRS